MKRIDKIHDGVDLEAIAQKWIKIGMSTDPIDHDRAKAAVCKAYECGDPDVGKLVEMKSQWLGKPGRFLVAECPRNGRIVEGVPYVSDIDGKPINTVIAAQAWRIGDPQDEYIHPERRT